LLVVTVDRLPAWMLAAYGATWVATPSIDALAARGVVFDRAIVPSTDPRDAIHAIIGTGDGSLPAAAADRGWRAALVTDDAALAAEAPLGPRAEVRIVAAAPARAAAADESRTNVARLVDEALAVVATGRHLVWVHVGGLAVAWDAPDAYRDRYVDPDDPPPPPGGVVPGFAVDATGDPDVVVGVRHLFAGQLTLLDGQLARLFAAVPTWAACLVGVRGLPLGLHGWVGVGGPDIPWGELVHVPAILVDAAGRMAGQRYGELVVPADLGATLACLVQGGNATGPSAAAGAADGVDLAGLFSDWSTPVRRQVAAVGRDAAALVTPSWHLLADRPAAPDGHADDHGRVRLFAKPDDFFELCDVADRCADVTEELRQALAAELAGRGTAGGQTGPPPG
jgi:arylsulfatase A-like enzyme